MTGASAAHQLEGFQHLDLGQAVSPGTSDVGRVGESGDDQLVGFATQRERACVGQNLALIDIDFPRFGFKPSSSDEAL